MPQGPSSGDPDDTRPPIVVVGAGLAGLTCAVTLSERGARVLVLEAGETVGGRVRTDVVDGHLVDRGFQVLLTAYPEAQAHLDHGALDLRAFEPGALVHREGQLHKIADPLRRPGSLWATLRAPIGGLGDKLRVGWLRLALGRAELDELLARPAQTTRERLRELGLSDDIVASFFRPFYGGVLLDPELATSSRMFDYTFACFTRGEAVIPAAGMAAIPEQLAARLPAGTLQLTRPVVDARADGVTTAAGEPIAASAVVIATDRGQPRDLIGEALDRPAFKGTTLLAFSLPRGAFRPRSIVLNGDPDDGPIDHYCVPSAIADGYAPADRDVLYATILDRPDAPPPGADALRDAAIAQLERWHGTALGELQHLATRRIDRALPELHADDQGDVARSVELPDGRFVCGDHRDAPSIQGAMRSGRRAAEAVFARLRAR